MMRADPILPWHDAFTTLQPAERRRSARTVNHELAWAYCRVSTIKDEQELSLEEQTRWAKSFAKERGLQLVIYEERASAKSIHGRKEFIHMMSELIALPKDKRPALLLATSADRFARNMGDAIIAERALRDSGVSLYLRDSGGSLPTHTFAGQATLVAMSMGSQAENEARSNRAKASWERRRREGKPTSNKVPYGLQLRAERDTPAEGSAQWVRFAFKAYSDGIGMHTIAKRLRECAPSHRTVTAKLTNDGNPIVRERFPIWESNRVRKLLEQIRYRGVLVDEALFDRVQELLARRPHVKQKRVFEYPLSGAIKCAFCNRSFHGHATGANRKKRLANGRIAVYPNFKRVRYYSCTVCNYRINANIFEAWFKDHVQSIGGEADLLERWLRGESVDRDAAADRREIASLERQTDPQAVATLKTKAWNLALGGEHAAQDLEHQLARIDNETSEKRARLERLKRQQQTQIESDRSVAEARRLLSDFWPLYERATYENKRELVQNLVQSLGGATASKRGIQWTRRPTSIGDR